MGTSNKYGGPKGSNPLIPSWLGDADGVPPAAPPPPQVPPPVTPQLPGMPGAPEPQPSPRPVAPDKPTHLTGPRKAFNKFAKGGGKGYLRRALSDYVRKGTGGSKNAVARMGPSRQAARSLYQFVQSVNSDGLRSHLPQSAVAIYTANPHQRSWLHLRIPFARRVVSLMMPLPVRHGTKLCCLHSKMGPKISPQCPTKIGRRYSAISLRGRSR